MLALWATAAASLAARDRGDINRVPCPECIVHEWEVLQGAPNNASYAGEDAPPPLDPSRIGERDVVDNGIDHDYGDGYGATVSFTGYTSTSLCTSYKRTSHLNGHTKCPLTKDWYKMWQPDLSHAGGIECWVDDMTPIQSGSKLSNPAGTTIIMGSCPAAGTPPSEVKYPHGGMGQYDWRFGGIRPQDNPDAALYPEVAKFIEDSVNKTGKKTLLKGVSGGTINSYAFLMSQTLEWRKKHILAWVPMSPVFGGTIASLSSILYGWNIKGGGDLARCIGRSVAIHTPSVFWMWPHPGASFLKGEWNRTEVLIETPKRNYTAYDLDALLADMGLTQSQKLYDLEKNDLLGTFAPPMVDTYVYYGYGSPTIAGFKHPHNISVDEFGPAECPPGGMSNLKRTWDDGDVTAPRRSCARAGMWAEAHARAGVVLKNYGYYGQKHSSSCTVPECTHDYNCMMAKLESKPPPADCK